MDRVVTPVSKTVLSDDEARQRRAEQRHWLHPFEWRPWPRPGKGGVSYESLGFDGPDPRDPETLPH